MVLLAIKPGNLFDTKISHKGRGKGRVKDRARFHSALLGGGINPCRHHRSWQTRSYCDGYTTITKIIEILNFGRISH